MSVPSLILLLLASANYIFSFRFKSAYAEYQLALNQSSAIAEICAIAGAQTLANYSLVMVHGVGSFVLCMYTLAFLLKFVYMGTTLLCPICTMRMKLFCRKKPNLGSYEHYRNEFDFEAFALSEEEECELMPKHQKKPLD